MLSQDNAARLAEQSKYITAYTHDGYHMGRIRFDAARAAIAHAVVQAGGEIRSYLDVGCGQGELMRYVSNLYYGIDVHGVEIVPELADRENVTAAWAHNLPFDDDSFDLVTCCDVVEHLIPDDTEPVLSELARVAKKAVYLTANNQPSKNHEGEELHINIRSYDEWDALIRAAFPKWTVTRTKEQSISPGWLAHG